MGKGWFGNTKGHQMAGRLGGLARAKNAREKDKKAKGNKSKSNSK